MQPLNLGASKLNYIQFLFLSLDILYTAYMSLDTHGLTKWTKKLLTIYCVLRECDSKQQEIRKKKHAVRRDALQHSH